MHTTRTMLITSLTLAAVFALGGQAVFAAEPAGPAPSAAPPLAGAAIDSSPPAAPARKLHVGLSFLPMGIGKYIYTPGALSAPIKSDAAFAYGIGLSAGYEILPRLVVGLAPQVIFNVKEKAPEIVSDPVRQYDLLARIAYVLPVAEGTSVYAEVLPGFSILTNDAESHGAVVAFGLGASVDVSERVFVNLGAGYQLGFQSWSMGPNTFQSRTRFVRVALGGGLRF